MQINASDDTQHLAPKRIECVDRGDGELGTLVYARCDDLPQSFSRCHATNTSASRWERRARASSVGTMNAPTEKELRAVAAALRAERAQWPPRGRPIRPAGAAQTKEGHGARAHQQLMALFDKAGVARDELAKVRAESLAGLRRLRDEARAPTADATPRAAAAARAALASRREASELVARHKRTGAGADWKLVLLDAPFLVLPSGDINLDSVTIKPQNTVVRASATWHTPNPDNAFDSVDYWFVWKNPSDAQVLVNVWSIMSLDGFIDALAEPGNDYAYCGVAVWLTLLEWWNQPPTRPPYQASQDNADPPGLYASGGGSFGLGDYETSLVSGAYDVWYSQFLIPGNGVAVFKVSTAVLHEIQPLWPYFDNNGGFADFDFASDGRQMMCPAVLLSVLS